MNPPKLSESVIRAAATPRSFERGREYYDDGAISNTAIRGNLLMGDCAGTQEPYYRVQVELDPAGIGAARCTCPYDSGGLCKHVIALLLTYMEHPEDFVVRREPAELLAELSPDDLLALFTRLLQQRPELQDWVEAALAAPAPSGAIHKPPRKKVDAEVYRRQVHGILHSLDRMRPSEAYWHVGDLTGQLDELRESAIKFLEAGDPETALAILMALLQEAGHGIEYIDDSDGLLGEFMNDLGQPLAEAILSLDLSPAERAEIARQLEKETEFLADYGMDEGVDLAIQAATVYWDRDAEPFRRAEAELAQGIEEPEELDDEDAFDEEWEEDSADDAGWPSDLFGDLTEAKLNVLKRQGRVEEYLALCQETGRHLRYSLMLCDLDRVPDAVAYSEGHLTSAEEAYEMAERLRTSGHVDEAVALGERGLTLGGSRARLGEWLGPIEEVRGRTQEALQAWLAAFGERPSLSAYETLKRLAGGTWPERRTGVMEMLGRSHDAMALAEVLLSEQEWDEAIKVAERPGSWYQVAETVTDAVTPYRPEWAARTSIRQAERLMVEAKSKNYPLAARWLERARRAYAQMGQTREWETYLQQTKEQYRRRPALQAQLNRL